MPSSGPSGQLSALPSIATSDVPSKSPSETPSQLPSPGLDPICSTVTSDFQDGDEEWTIDGEAEGPFWAAGYIFATDDYTQDSSGTWYFLAPAKFHGDFSGAYGGSLSFQLRQNITDDQYIDYSDVYIKGNGYDGQHIWYNMANNPGTDWTEYSIVFLVGVGWRVNTGSNGDCNEDNPPASEDEIRAVLSDISNILIRGEYRTGPDKGSLRNVVLECGA
jgi:alkaline phosphatase D